MKRIPREILKEYNADCYLVLNSSDIRYFSGLVSSNIALLITEAEAFVFSDGRYKYHIESQSLYTPVVCTGGACIAGAAKIKELGLKRVLIDPESFSYGTYLKAFAEISGNFITASGITNFLRARKSEYEIECIKRAQNIAEESLKEILPLVKEGVTTAEIAAKLDFAMKIKGSEEPAFSTIVLTGAGSADCHGVPDGSVVKKGDFVLFDFGATFKGLRSDMTRTFAVGEADDLMRSLYETVLDAHYRAAEKIKPGIKASEVDSAARKVISDAGYGELFLHSTGHGVGYDIHEFPTVSSKSEAILEENMIITDEPGIYIKDKFGIRIEDMYIVGKNEGISMAEMSKNLIILK